jgi:hypothetical protein
MTGQPVISGVPHYGRKWFVEDIDLASCFVDHLEGNLGFKEWINSYRGVREAAYFSLDNPFPFLQMLECSWSKAVGQPAYRNVRGQ